MNYIQQFWDRTCQNWVERLKLEHGAKGAKHELPQNQKVTGLYSYSISKNTCNHFINKSLYIFIYKQNDLIQNFLSSTLALGPQRNQ